MRYIIKTPDNKIIYMEVISSIPRLPEDFEIVGLESEVNPSAIDLTVASLVNGVLIEDSDKVLAKRQVKANSVLDSIRALREPLLKAADISINIKEDIGQDTSDLRAWRTALRTCTDSFKKVNGDAKLSCEDMIPEEFVFPVKPE
jgi:hypothetical protein